MIIHRMTAAEYVVVVGRVFVLEVVTKTFTVSLALYSTTLHGLLV